MTVDEAFAAVRAHYEQGITSHDRFDSLTQAINVAHDRFTKAQAAAGSIADPNHNHDTARRLLQLAGLCIKTCVDLDLTEPATEV